MAEEHGAGVVPVHKDDTGAYSFLIIQQNTGHWGFPKGHRERGESERETALRELDEETGIDHVTLATDFRYEQTYTLRRNGQLVHKTVLYFLGFTEHRAVTLQAQELQDCAWLNAADAHKRITYEENRALLNAANTFLRSQTTSRQ